MTTPQTTEDRTMTTKLNASQLRNLELVAKNGRALAACQDGTGMNVKTLRALERRGLLVVEGEHFYLTASGAVHIDQPELAQRRYFDNRTMTWKTLSAAATYELLESERLDAEAMTPGKVAHIASGARAETWCHHCNRPVSNFCVTYHDTTVELVDEWLKAGDDKRKREAAKAKQALAELVAAAKAAENMLGGDYRTTKRLRKAIAKIEEAEAGQ